MLCEVFAACRRGSQGSDLVVRLPAFVHHIALIRTSFVRDLDSNTNTQVILVIE